MSVFPLTFQKYFCWLSKGKILLVFVFVCVCVLVLVSIFSIFWYQNWSPGGVFPAGLFLFLFCLFAFNAFPPMLHILHVHFGIAWFRYQNNPQLLRFSAFSGIMIGHQVALFPFVFNHLTQGSPNYGPRATPGPPKIIGVARNIRI